MAAVGRRTSSRASGAPYFMQAVVTSREFGMSSVPWVPYSAVAAIAVFNRNLLLRTYVVFLGDQQKAAESAREKELEEARDEKRRQLDANRWGLRIILSGVLSRNGAKIRLFPHYFK